MKIDEKGLYYMDVELEGLIGITILRANTEFSGRKMGVKNME